MNLDIIYFFLYLFSSILLILSLIFLAKYRRFHDTMIINSINVYLFGLFFLFIYILIESFNYSNFIIKSLFPSYFSIINIYIKYLLIISNLFFILMISVCYLISVILLKEANT